MSAAVFQPFPMRPGRRAQAWRHHPAFWRPRHFHAEPELNLVLRGTAKVAMGDQERVLSAGEFVVFAPGQDHALVEASPDLDLFVVALHPELAAQSLGSRLPRSSQVGAFEPSRLSLYPELLARASSDFLDEEARSQLVEFFGAAQKLVRDAHVTSRRALSALLEEPHLSATEVGARLRTAPSELSRKFHGEWGVPLVEVRARLKLMRFVEAVDGGRDFTSAAFSAGFGSYAQCHRVFGRHLGCSPSRYFAGARALVNAARRSS